MHMHHQTQDAHPDPQWKRAKAIRALNGLTAPQLMRYADAGMIRTSHIRRPGQSRGVRLFSLTDIQALIEGGMESPSGG